MGDLVAITTWPNHQNLFYFVTSCGVTFDVMAEGNAAIGLARKPGRNIDYWVGIGENNLCWIKKSEENCRSVQVQNILSPVHYTKFWLQWNANCIRLGRYGEQSPIVSFPNKLPVLKYITFGVLNNNPVYWKIDLPPVRPNIKPDKQITGGKLTWVEVEDQLPDGALIGGFENECLYIIRARHRGSLTPGKFVPSEGGGYISWGGDAHGKGEFEVLCGFDCNWVSTREDRIPLGAVIGGHSEGSQERLYVGRAMHNGHVIPGKVQPSHKVCYIPFKGKEIGKRKFEILVEPTEFRDMHLSNVGSDSASDSEPEEDNSWQVEESSEEDDPDDYRHDMEEILAM